MKYMRLFCLALLFLRLPCYAQDSDLQIREGVKKVEIPFEFENNFIVVKVIFNDVFPLRFIFDTGAEHTILTRREITDLLQINYERQFVIYGSDLSTELYAYLARGVNLRLNKMIALNRSILVLDEDYFRFQEYGGINVQGIIGADLFRRFVVKIDYRRRVITLYDPREFEPPGGNYEVVPIQINRNKPYIIMPTVISDSTIKAKYLLDTGASLSLLLYTNTDSAFQLPPQYVRSKIGMGLGGYLQGFLGRVAKLKLGNLPLNGVVTNFQEVPPDVDSSFMNERNGIVGNQILSRFQVIIDYIGEKIYIAPERNYQRKFKYDRSGLILAASGASLNVFTVVDIISNSPAAEAGIQVGDEIKTVNGIPTTLMHLGDLTDRFQKRAGKKIKLVVKRGDQKLKFQFHLRELI